MDFKLPKREQNSNKGTFGKVLNLSGSEYMPGAAYLSSVATLRSGAGYVELVSCERTLTTISTLAPEIVLVPYSKLLELIKEATVLLVGCGLSTTDEAKQNFSSIINHRNNLPTVIDDDGLNILSTLNIKLDKNVILTPHPKEASRLLGCSLDDILIDTKTSAKKISEKYNCIAVLKTYKTIVTDGEIIYKNTTGCSALAKAGSGDVLAGIIAGLLAQKVSPFEAASLGVYLHGLTGELAAKDLSEYGVLATDLLRYIPVAIKLNKDIQTMWSFIRS